jgi:hypothetical protein
MSQFVAPTGYVDLDNDCEFSIDLKSTRSRESVNPKEDLAFYFNTYIVPKYGLNNINVSNVASFMKDLEMNWTKLTPDMKNQVMNIMVDDILNKDTSFRSALLQKLNIPTTSPQPSPVISKSTFGKSKSFSSFGSVKLNSKMFIIIAILIAVFIFLKKKKKTVSYGRLS